MLMRRSRTKVNSNDITILNMETATTNCSVALSINGITKVLKEDKSKSYSHAEKLHLFIEQALKEANISKEQLDAVAVSKGPGSYTGLRIGVSSAKGLCFALNIPLISVPTLQSLALQANVQDGLVVPMIDARRMEVYTSSYTPVGKEQEPTRALILDENAFAKNLEETRVHFIGNGVMKFKELCKHENAVFLPEILPSAKEMSNLSYDKFRQGLFEDVAYFEPYYLKDFMVGAKK